MLKTGRLQLTFTASGAWPNHFQFGLGYYSLRLGRVWTEKVCPALYKLCREGFWEISVYLIDLLKLRADVLLLSQTLANAPVGRGEDDFVWERNTATETHRGTIMISTIIWRLCDVPEDSVMKPHPCRMTSAIAATCSSYSTTSLSELFAFLLERKDRSDIY